uniref:non-specific serine/threonine protein kinase n=1 Tax=Caenorhabditis tropicalis TaxID=1561998 RepID=A0A1I7TA13_9PELO
MAPATAATQSITSQDWAPLARRSTPIRHGVASTSSQSCSSIPQLRTKRESGVFQRQAAPPRMVRSAPAKSMLRRSNVVERAQEITLDGLAPIKNPFYTDTSLPFFDQAFKIQKSLGNGSFGEVWAARSLVDKRLYAVKIPKTPNTKTTRHDEARAFIRLPQHKNLLKFYGAWEETDKKILIQTEVCSQSLRDACNHWIPEEEIWDIVVDMVQVIDHFHRRNLIHNDVKPENIFLTEDGVCRLGDLGLVEDLSEKDHGVEEGDSRYLAPEVLSVGSSKASDIFSLGMTFLEVTTDIDLPSHGEQYHLLRDGLIPEEFFNGRTKDLEDLIRLMIDRDPKNRPTSGELMDHPKIKQRIEARNKFIEEVENTSSEVPPFLTPPASSPSSSPSSSPVSKRFRIATPKTPLRNLSSSDDEEDQKPAPRRPLRDSNRKAGRLGLF